MASQTPVWFITAASSGFGHEIALLALSRGHRVIATARSASRVKDLADAGAHTLDFDVTSPLSTIEGVAKEIEEKFGRVDYLINAAGYILDAAVEEATPEEVQRQFNTNVFGTTNTIRAFLPLMRKQEVAPSGTRGTVVTFGSVGSWHGGATYAFYSMTKWCMSSLAESLDLELSPFKIRATVIEPGYFRTGFLNPSAKVTSALRLPAYEDESTTTGQVRQALLKTDGNQPGDVKKGAAVCVDMLTCTGVAEGKELPVRIVLGTDCEEGIRSKCASTIKLLDEWAPVIRSTDHDQ